jgi:hypothetical protein
MEFDFLEAERCVVGSSAGVFSRTMEKVESDGDHVGNGLAVGY